MFEALLNTIAYIYIYVVTSHQISLGRFRPSRASRLEKAIGELVPPSYRAQIGSLSSSSQDHCPHNVTIGKDETPKSAQRP